MDPRTVKRIIAVASSLALVGTAIAFAWPRAVPVDLAPVVKGPMDVTVDDEGKTRVRDVYTVSAPLTGKVLRIPGHAGDAVVANETVIAEMQPSDPSFHDARYHEELKAAFSAADAAVALAEHEVHRAEAALTFSTEELERARSLADRKVISQQNLDKAVFDVDSGRAAVASAKAQLQVRRNERASAEARLKPAASSALADPECCVRIRPPVTGRILKVIQESEAVVPAGAPLIEIGDPGNLEVVADLLSSDAVRIDVGSAARIDGWGGPPIAGRVSRIEPAGFLKISALGIEEQRVRTTIDLVDPKETWARLGHDYRVIVHVTIWHGDDVATVPVASLFRTGDAWTVFALRDGRARATPVEVGHRNSRVAEVVSGLSIGDRVVLHPSDRISDGVSIAEREIH